jgi:hypothetical protein
MARIVLAERLSRRGAGLGNEMLPWAKGFIASQVLDAHLVGPSWGLNPRRYWRNFASSRLDFVGEALLRLLPVQSFTESDYYSTGILDYGEAIRKWAERRGLLRRRHFVVSVGGMWGGYLAIASARSFLRARLLNSRNALANIFQAQAALDQSKLVAAVHLRLAGDFSAAQQGREIRSQFNVQIPMQWYRGVCEALRRKFGERIQFCFFTDRETPAYRELVADYSPKQVRRRELSECSDLLLMADADLRVCSVSSYSMVACFLSEGPYLWYEPQLHCEGGMYNLWGHEPRQQQPGSPTATSAQHLRAAGEANLRFRGYPVSDDYAIPDSLIEELEAALSAKNARTDLMRYGCYPILPRHPAKVFFGNESRPHPR